MTFEVPDNPEKEGVVEAIHDELATEHGRDNILVVETGDGVVSIVGAGVGTIDPVDVDVHTEDAV